MFWLVCGQAQHRVGNGHLGGQTIRVPAQALLSVPLAPQWSCIPSDYAVMLRECFLFFILTLFGPQESRSTAPHELCFDKRIVSSTKRGGRPPKPPNWGQTCNEIRSF